MIEFLDGSSCRGTLSNGLVELAYA